MLSDAQKVKIRYHLGYPAYGQTYTPASGYRFFKHYGQLEYRMTNLLPEEETKVGEMITKLDELEAAIDTSGENMDTAAAAVWTRNPDELAERQQLYLAKRRRLGVFLGVPLHGDQGNSLRLVV